jgi:hypothetical protein
MEDLVSSRQRTIDQVGPTLERVRVVAATW